MKPEFEQFKGDRSEPMDVVAGRIPTDLKDQLELIASIEGGGLSGLVLEGAVRVIQDRQNDPDFASRIQPSLQEQADELETKLARTRSLIQNFLPKPE